MVGSSWFIMVGFKGWFMARLMVSSWLIGGGSLVMVNELTNG